MAASNTTAVTAGDNDSETASTASGATMIVLSIIIVACRFYVRLHLKSGLKWDDWFILIALVSLIAAGVLVLVASIVDPNAAWLELSYTDPNYKYTPANQTHLLLSWVASILYFCIVCATKLSILFMYHRIFSISLAFRRQVYVITTIVSLFWAATFFANVFTCIPFKYSWISSVSPAPYCFNFNIFWFSTGIIEAVLDVSIISLPVGMVVKLHLSLKKKIGLVGVFLLGAFGIVTGVVRIREAYLPGERSPSWDESEVWSTIHAGVGILCACLPVCWPLSGVLLSKIRVGTTTLRNWRSYKLNWSSGQKSGSAQSTEVIVHAARAHKPGEPETELLAIPDKNISPGLGATVAYPQPALSLGTDNLDETYVIQGTPGYTRLGDRV